MAANYFKDDPTFGLIDLDNEYITDAFVIDRYVGNQLYAWGNADYGRTGLGNLVHRSSPVQVGSMTNWKLVNGGTYSTGAIKTDGTLWMWGRNGGGNGSGTLGLNDTVHRSSPVQVGTLTNWKQVSIGDSHAGAVKIDGTLWTWGGGTLGELGNSIIGSFSSPVQVGTGTTWKQVMIGGRMSFAIKTDGTMWSWGVGDNGELGNNLSGAPGRKSSPTQVGSLTNWKQVHHNGYTGVAIKTDGTLWSWGYGAYASIGDGTIISRSSPVQIGSMTNWKLVSGGAYHCHAIKTDGTLWTWGSNDKGQLGLGDSTNRSSPVQVGSGTNWKIVQGGRWGLYAIKTDGTLWACGYNSYGSLGQGDRVHRSSPVQVGTLTNWKYAIGGGYPEGQVMAITFADIT